MSTREHADITKVEKRGEIYTVHGVADGKHSSFHVDAKALDSMSHKDAESFMKRNIRNVATHKEED